MSNEVPSALELFKTAKEIYRGIDDGLEVDIPATEEEAEELVSRNDEGAFVRAWVFVDYVLVKEKS